MSTTAEDENASEHSAKVSFSVSDDSVITKSVPSSGSDESVNTTLSSYRNYEEEAKELVKLILDQSMQAYQQEMANTVHVQDVEWPTGENFTTEKAEEAIDRLVKVNAHMYVGGLVIPHSTPPSKSSR